MPDDNDRVLMTRISPDPGAGPMALLSSRRFAGRPEQVRHARRFVELAVGECSAAEYAVLLTSELASNAVRHTESGNGGSFEVSVYLGDSRLRVEVADEGSARTTPQPRLIDLDEEQVPGGRGMAIVDLCAACWGHSGDDSGRVVWFELPRDGSAAGQDSLELPKGA
ncbi:hypothetical protein Pta02_80690 [Planobispora takensis]|uniref:Histidine kinase/HSP90-like ATPase domain-containing protein n=2 Tax=Planobispora takensis TaxID=1367882 RepID=A0A8J3T7W9_9ACTN|nr:hypothetical protein Pta02_80690 [Planobispora takensis]